MLHALCPLITLSLPLTSHPQGVLVADSRECWASTSVGSDVLEEEVC
jgi:hypothetical protein